MRRLILIFLVSALTAAGQISDKEAAWGRRYLQELGQKWKIVETPGAIAGLAQSLSAQRLVEVHVVESDRVLANYLPGGIIYLSTALIQSATVGELAAILAHEIAHIGHLIVTTGPPANIPLIFMGTGDGLCIRTADSMYLFPQSLKPRVVANETEADLLAAHYLERAGYGAAEVKPILDRLRRAAVSSPALRKAPTLLR